MSLMEIDQLVKAGEQLLSLGEYAAAFEKFKTITGTNPSEQKGWLGMIRAYTNDFTSSFGMSQIVTYYDEYNDPYIKYERNEKPLLQRWMSNAFQVQSDAAELREYQQKLEAYLQKLDQGVERRRACTDDLHALLAKSSEYTKTLRVNSNMLREQQGAVFKNLVEHNSSSGKSEKSRATGESLAFGGVLAAAMVSWLLSLIKPGLGGTVFVVCVGIFVVTLISHNTKKNSNKKKQEDLQSQYDQLTAQIAATENNNKAAHQNYNDQLINEFCYKWGLRKEEVLVQKANVNYTVESLLEYK